MSGVSDFCSSSERTFSISGLGIYRWGFVFIWNSEDTAFRLYYQNSSQKEFLRLVWRWNICFLQQLPDIYLDSSRNSSYSRIGRPVFEWFLHQTGRFLQNKEWSGDQ